MSGPVSNEALAAKIDALNDKIVESQRAHQREHSAHEAAHTREHQQTEKALQVAADLARENKADANEWRGAMDDRERRFATKDDIAGLAGKISDLERAEIRRAEQEKTRIERESEERRQFERQSDQERQEGVRRVARSQWMIGLIVGISTFLAATIVGILLRVLGL